MYIGPGKRRSSLVREVDARRKAETGDGERGAKRWGVGEIWFVDFCRGY